MTRNYAHNFKEKKQSEIILGVKEMVQCTEHALKAFDNILFILESWPISHGILT